MKNKKQKATATAPQSTAKTKGEPIALVPLLLIGLYAMVGFVPNFDAFEVLGPQWIYLTAINILCLVYIVSAGLSGIVKTIFSTLPARAFALFVIIAGISISYAGNKVEALYCFIRYLTTLLVFLNIAVLLYRKSGILPALFTIISVILLIESLQTISRFFDEIKQGVGFDKTVLDLTLNSGNKNILAASLVIKMPFLLYLIHKAKPWGKLGYGAIFLLAVAALVVLNARSALVALILITAIYLVFYIAQLLQAGTGKKALLQIGFVLLPLLLGILLSNSFIDYSKSLTDSNATSYGSFTERVSTISLSKDASNGRYLLWSNAVTYIKAHPLLGAGIGNWKLAAIPFDNQVNDDYTASYHVHNDFLEMTAETGIMGGLVFLSIFLICAWTLFRAYRQQSFTPYTTLPVFVLMALGCYVVDAGLNFPVERPVMQCFFALILALVVNIALQAENNNAPQPAAGRTFRNGYTGITAIFLAGSLFLHLLYYQSLVAQGKFSQDSLKAVPTRTWAEVAGTFPAIPNMNIFCIPIGEIKAKYLLKDKRYDQALQVLNECKDVNPALGFNDYIRGAIYTQQNQLDSALKYAKIAFAKKPRDQNSYYLLSALYASVLDSNQVKAIFQQELGLRNEAWVWNEYLKNMAAMGIGKERLNTLADSALALFPTDAGLLEKKSLFGNTEAYQQTRAEGFAHFSRAEFAAAIVSFTKAIAMMPREYTNYENVALGHFNLKQYEEAITWFKKLLPVRTVNNGKAEYFLGLSYLQTNNTAEACRNFQAAANSQYPDAANQLSLHCK